MICNWSWDPSFCFISAFFRRVTEEYGIDLNTKNYAQMKRNACQARARNLRLLVQSNPSSDNGNSSVRCVDGYSFARLFARVFWFYVPSSTCGSLRLMYHAPPPPPYARAHMEDPKHQPLIGHFSEKDTCEKRLQTKENSVTMLHITDYKVQSLFTPFLKRSILTWIMKRVRALRSPI